MYCCGSFQILVLEPNRKFIPCYIQVNAEIQEKVINIFSGWLWIKIIFLVSVLFLIILIYWFKNVFVCLLLFCFLSSFISFGFAFFLFFSVFWDLFCMLWVIFHKQEVWIINFLQNVRLWHVWQDKDQRANDWTFPAETIKRVRWVLRHMLWGPEMKCWEHLIYLI